MLDQLKFQLGPKLWEHDGSLHGDPTVVGSELVPYLQGLADAGNEWISGEAQELIDAIDRYGEVVLEIAE